MAHSWATSATCVTSGARFAAATGSWDAIPTPQREDLPHLPGDRARSRADVVAAVAKSGPVSGCVGVVPRHVPEGALQVPGATVQLDQNAEQVVSDIGPGSGAHRSLAAPDRNVVRALDVISVSLLRVLSMPSRSPEQLCDQASLGEPGSAVRDGQQAPCGRPPQENGSREETDDVIGLKLRHDVEQRVLDPDPTQSSARASDATDSVATDGGSGEAGRYFTTEVAGGFTGRVVGVGALASRTRISSFHYEGI